MQGSKECDNMVDIIQGMLMSNGIIEKRDGIGLHITETAMRLILEYTGRGQKPQEALQNTIVTMAPQATFLEVHGMMGFMLSFLWVSDESIGRKFGSDSFQYDLISVYDHLKMNGSLK